MYSLLINKLPAEAVDLIYEIVHKKQTSELVIHLKRIFNQVKYDQLLKRWDERVKFCKKETIVYLLKDTIEFTNCPLRNPRSIKNLKI
jgi:hypothetical protein